ncbi:MAG: hypothetical protein J0L63_07005 [Anaerolineae bacterium]|nr:hypothetical protein [Anaerolineae bacterium]
MSDLPVREMVLYKHGVGFFVREGDVEGEQVTLTFRQDEINDVLKSLAVFDQAGGQVLGIHYQTPMDREARLASSSIQLSDLTSLRDLLVDLRGRQVELRLETTPGTVETVRGRVVGIDRGLNSGTDERINELVTVLEADGMAQVFRLEALRGVKIEDAQAAYDLTYFLDSSLSEDVRRAVKVRLSAGSHRLAVYYVAPSPTWRVSYRLVAEADEAGEGGEALLQGWGLFDNRLEEDLDDVRVTLVAGQPISFIYDLYESHIPKRATVRDEARIAPGPIEFDARYEELEAYDGDEEADHGLRFMAAAPAPAAAGMARKMSMGGMKSATAPAATAQDVGEFFQYAVTTPVSVKRGESALVPIIGALVKYERELLYNRNKLPDHPVVALRFENGTGLTLERGPVTVVEDGDYKGEAVIPFTKDGLGVYVPFAVELGVRISEIPNSKVVTTGVHIKDALLVYEQYETQTVMYFIENTTGKAVTVTLEEAVDGQWELVNTDAPALETASERRWRVKLPARAKTDFVTEKRRRLYRRTQLERLDEGQLQEIIKNRWLDAALQGELRAILGHYATIQKGEQRLKELEQERVKLYGQQEQLRANLNTLQATGQEAALRKRMLGQLENSQNRLEAIEVEMSEENRLIASARQQVKDAIAALG